MTDESPNPVTLADVANEAGVSAAAASLALRGKPGVSEETRGRVLSAASALGYRPRTPSPRTTTIGILVKSSPISGDGHDAFYGPLVAGISESCASMGIDVGIEPLPVDEHHNPIDAPRVLDAAHVDGVLILGAFLTERMLRTMRSRPVVLVDGYAAEPHALTSVVTDNTVGGFDATTHLLQLGHRSILFAGGGEDPFPSIEDRFAGYRSAMSGANLRPQRADASIDEPAACAEAAIEAIGRGSATAVVAANDAVALEIHARLGDRIPTEVSLVGFDDIAAASFVRPALTSMTVDKVAMGRLAVAMVLHRLAHPTDPPAATVLRASLTIRETTAPPYHP